MLSSYTQGLIILICINVIAVIGVSLLTSFTGLFSFGNAGFMAVGAYVSALSSVLLHMPFLLSLALGIVVAGVIGLGLGRLTLGLKGDYFLIATLGFGQVVQILIEFFDKVTGGPRGFANIPLKTTLWIAVLFALGSITIAVNIIHSKYGRNFTAVREQEIAAEAVGIDTFRFKQIVFVLSAMFAGFSGGLFAHYYMYIVPKAFDLNQSALFTITVVVGGLGSLSGSVISCVILTLLPELFRGLSNYRMLFYGVAVVLIILFKPSGLMGYHELSLIRVWERVRASRRNTFGKEKKS